MPCSTRMVYGFASASSVSDTLHHLQAMLEADPASREPQDSYLARYQTFARDELNEALSKYDALQSSLGGRCMCTVCSIIDGFL